MKLLLWVLVITSAFFSASYSASDNDKIPSVATVDMSKLMGRWYEIARLPNFFENGLTHVTTTYALSNDGKYSVVNAGIKEGQNKSVKGYFRVPDSKEPGRFKLAFFLFFESDYILVDLDQDNYQYMVMSGGARDQLWIFSREAVMDEALYQKLLEKVKALGFDITKIIKVPQN